MYFLACFGARICGILMLGVCCWLLLVLCEQVFPDWKGVYGLLGFASGPTLDVFSGIFRYTNLWYFHAGYVLLDPDFRARHWKRVSVRPKGGKWLHNQVGFWFNLLFCVLMITLST